MTLLALLAILLANPQDDPRNDFLYDDVGSYHRAVSTRSAPAQRYVDQGFVLAWAFNHDEAMRAFGEAARLDPGCAIAWWGVALVNGPHINNPAMDAEHSRAAWQALGKAREHIANASATEHALIEALGKRYAEPPPEDRRPLDEAYAAAMREVWRTHPDDADVGTLCAEAMMDLRPWDLWTLDGKPQPGTDEIVATLEAVLAKHPEHPGANHLYVHTMEASPQPDKAMAAADRLRTLVPGAGHLVHMPAHIDVRTGHYHRASEANEKAIAADQKHAALFPRAGFYRIYMAHNHHFLAFASMMEGRAAAALKAAREMVEGVPQEFIDNAAPLIDGYMPVVLHVMVRFGRWEEILREPEFDARLTMANAIRHYARGIALAALNRVAEAQGEALALAAAITKVEASQPMGNNPATTVLGIATHMLAGEIAVRALKVDDAVRELRAAAQIEDSLRYDEPPDWMQPVRHTLGATLLAAGRAAEAEPIFREDLKRFPENGWSLIGLLRCLQKRGAVDEAKDVEARFARAWSRADVKITSPCLCQPG